MQSTQKENTKTQKDKLPKYLLLIPESRKRPITESLLYKQIVRFLQSEGIEDRFETVFISIVDGIVEAEKSNKWNYKNSKIKLPPQRFRSGRLWITKEMIGAMADNIVDYIKTREHKNTKIIAYVRGAYLEAIRLAAKKSEIEIKEIFSDDELSQLKKKGIMWMKVGLRMSTAFIVFRMKIRYMLMDGENRQASLPF